MTKGRLNLNLLTLLFAFFTCATWDAVAQTGPDLRIGYSNFPMLLHGSSLSEYNHNNPGFDYLYEVGYHAQYEPLSNLDSYQYSYGDLVSPGQFTLEYTGEFSRRLDWTFSASWASAYSAITSSYTRERIGSYYLGIYTLMAGLRLKWINRPDFQLYSGIGLGISMLQETFCAGDQEDLMDPIYYQTGALDINWLGMSVGSKFYAFAELTSGSIGFLQAGVGYRF